MNWTLLPIADFYNHASQWGQLNAETMRSPCLRPDFIEPLIANFGSGRELLAICSNVGGARVAATIVAPSGTGRWQTFHPPQATVCLWLQSTDTPVTALAGALLKSLPAPALSFSLHHLDPALVPRPVDGSLFACVDYIPTPRLAANADFEQYWASRGKNLRHNVRRQHNRLAKDCIAVSLARFDQPEGVRAGVTHYSELEAAGWKAKLGTAVTKGDAQHQFYQSALAAAAEAGGHGLVYLLRYDDAVVAVDLCIKSFGTCVILKTTYDERIAQTSPALLLRHAYFQELFADEEVRVIEFYGRVMDWHTKWTDDIRTMYHLNVYRHSVLHTLHSLHSKRFFRASGFGVGDPQI